MEVRVSQNYEERGCKILHKQIRGGQQPSISQGEGTTRVAARNCSQVSPNRILFLKFF
jgi:hypothetical protein